MGILDPLKSIAGSALRRAERLEHEVLGQAEELGGEAALEAKRLASSFEQQVETKGAALIGAVTGRVPSIKPDSISATSPKARAEASWQALATSMAIPHDAGHYASTGQSLKPAAAWSQGQAVVAALDSGQLSGDLGPAKAAISALKQFELGKAYAPDPHPSPGTPRYYDDNAWIGLGLMQAYQQTGSGRYLSQAEGVLSFIKTGVSAQGGLRWVEDASNPTRNTCSTGPAIELAMRVYDTTHDPADLELAKKLMGFLDSTLRQPNGLYADHVDEHGKVDPAIYSYNQGTPIGADILLYQATHDASYLTQAQQTAQAALTHFGAEGLWKESPAFNAIFFRNLMQLNAVAPDPAYKAALQTYLDRAWTQGRDPSTGLFTRGGIGAYGKPGNLLDQSGMVQMYSLLAMSPEQLAKLT